MPGLKRIRALSLARNNIPRIQGLDGLDTLEELTLASNRIASLTGLVALKNLVSLDVSDNLLRDDGELSKLPGGLHNVSVRSNPFCAKHLDSFDAVKLHLDVDAIDGEELDVAFLVAVRKFYELCDASADDVPWTETVLTPLWPVGFLGERGAACVLRQPIGMVSTRPDVVLQKRERRAELAAR